MFSDNQKISLRQLQALLILDLFGTSVITLPRKVTQVAGTDGWISVLLGGAMMLLPLWFIMTLGRRYPNQTLVETSQNLLTAPVGILVSLGLAVKLIIGGGLELRVFCEIIGQTMLFRTPILITVGAMALVCTCVAAYGYECRARTAEILFIFVFLPLVIILFIAAFSVDYNNLRPMFIHTTNDYWRGSLTTLYSFQGLELLLLVFPYLNKPQEARKSVMTAGILIGIFMTIVTVLTIAIFGEASVTSKLYPVLQMLDSIDFPGAFLDRQDVFMLWFWVASVFASVSAALFFSMIVFSRIFQKNHTGNRKWLFVIVPIFLWVAVAPSSAAKATEWLEAVKLYPGEFYILLLPVILLFIDIVKGRGNHEAQ